MFQFIYADVAYHSHPLIIYVSAQNWESILNAGSGMLEE